MIVTNRRYNIKEQLDYQTIVKMRTFTMVFVMIQAGLEVTTTSLKQRPFFLLVLATLPSVAEMTVVSLCCRYILQYPWNWSLLAG